MEQTESSTIGATEWQNWNQPFTATPVDTNIRAYQELVKTKEELEVTKKELETSKENYRYSQTTRERLEKELEEVHTFLDGFTSTPKGDNWNRQSLAVRLMTLLTKEFTWKGKD